MISQWRLSLNQNWIESCDRTTSFLALWRLNLSRRHVVVTKWYLKIGFVESQRHKSYLFRLTSVYVVILIRCLTSYYEDDIACYSEIFFIFSWRLSPAVSTTYCDSLEESCLPRVPSSFSTISQSHVPHPALDSVDTVPVEGNDHFVKSLPDRGSHHFCRIVLRHMQKVLQDLKRKSNMSSS